MGACKIKLTKVKLTGKKSLFVYMWELRKEVVHYMVNVRYLPTSFG